MPTVMEAWGGPGLGEAMLASENASWARAEGPGSSEGILAGTGGRRELILKSQPWVALGTLRAEPSVLGSEGSKVSPRPWVCCRAQAAPQP